LLVNFVNPVPLVLTSQISPAELKAIFELTGLQLGVIALDVLGIFVRLDPSIL
jgi:hypothetical protein